jgi:hypothetical protein
LSRRQGDRIESLSVAVHESETAAQSGRTSRPNEVVSHEEAAHLILDWAKNQTKIQDDTIIVIPLLLLLKKTYPCR